MIRVHFWMRQMTLCGRPNYGTLAIPEGDACCLPWRWVPTPDFEVCEACEDRWTLHKKRDDLCPCPFHEDGLVWDAIVEATDAR